MGVKIAVRRIIKLFGISAEMDLAWLLRDTKYAVIMIVSDIIQNIGMCSGMFLLAFRFGGICGMSANEVLFMSAYSSLITGLFLMFGARNNIEVSRLIGRGQMEHMFLQPLSLKAQLFTCSFQPFTNTGSLLTGIVLMCVAAARLHLHITGLWICMLLGYLLATMATITARAYLVSALAFYSPSAEDISFLIVNETWYMSTFPLGGMPAFVVFPLLTIMPEGLMAWFPSLCLLGRPPLHLTAYYPVIFALFITLAAGIVFKKGLNHYVRKGSNRYVPWGFRR